MAEGNTILYGSQSIDPRRDFLEILGLRQPLTTALTHAPLLNHSRQNIFYILQS